MKITVIIDSQEKEIELSDEQIIAIGQKFFELVSPRIEMKPIDFGVLVQPDDLLHNGDIITD